LFGVGVGVNIYIYAYIYTYIYVYLYIIYIYRYIVCATGKTAEEMLAILQVNTALIGP